LPVSWCSANAAHARTPPENRAPASRQAVSKASVSASFNNSTVTKSPLLFVHVSPSSNGKLGHSPPVLCAKVIQS